MPKAAVTKEDASAASHHSPPRRGKGAKAPVANRPSGASPFDLISREVGPHIVVAFYPESDIEELLYNEKLPDVLFHHGHIYQLHPRLGGETFYSCGRCGLTLLNAELSPKLEVGINGFCAGGALQSGPGPSESSDLPTDESRQSPTL